MLASTAEAPLDGALLEHRCRVLPERRGESIIEIGPRDADVLQHAAVEAGQSHGFAAVTAGALVVQPQTTTSNLAVAQTLRNSGREPLVAKGMLAVLAADGTLAGKSSVHPRRLLPGEAAQLTAEYAGELYGTLREEVERELQRGRHVVLAIDVAGARAVRAAYPAPRSVTVFLLPPSATALLERLGQRRSDDRRGVALRLAHAVDELREVPRYDHVVINDELDRAVADVERIIDNPPPPRAPDGAVAARLERLGQELAVEAARLQRAP